LSHPVNKQTNKQTDRQTDKLEATNILPNINRTHAPPNHPLAATEWSRLLLHDVICSQRVPFRRCRVVIGVHSTFLSLVTLIFDLGIQTRPSELNVFVVNLVQIRSVWFPKYFIHKEKNKKQKCYTQR